MRAADSATKRREAADFDRPDPIGAGTSPSGSRTERANLRVETLISIWFMARTSQSFRNRRLQLGRILLLALEAAKPGPLDLDLATVKTDLALVPPAVRPPVMTLRMAWTTDRSRIVIHDLAKGLRLTPSELNPTVGFEGEPTQRKSCILADLDGDPCIGPVVVRDRSQARRGSVRA